MNNKVKILLALSLAMPLAFAGAETTSTPVEKLPPPAIKRVEGKIENAKEKADKKIENLKERKEEAKNKLEEKKDKAASTTERRLNKQQEQVIFFTERTVNKLNAALERIEKLSSRTKERATIFVNNGKMTAEAKGKIDAKLAEAAAILGNAKTDAGKILDAAKTAMLTEKPKEAFKDVQNSAKKIQDDLKKAHAKVVEAITMIKTSLPKEEKRGNATTTNQ